MKHAFILAFLLLSACGNGQKTYSERYQDTEQNQTFEQRTTDAINSCDNLGCKNM